MASTITSRSSSPTGGLLDRVVGAVTQGPGLVWVGVVGLIWVLMPMLRLEAARIVAYDGVVLAVGGYLLLDLLVGSRVRSARSPRRAWRLTADGRLYGWYLLLIFAGLVSGMNAVSLKPWGIELATFVYLLIMLLVLDTLASVDIDRFVTVGIYVFAVVSLITGLASILSLVGIYKFSVFMAQQRIGVGDKFSGFARSPNQWASYFLSFYPLLLGFSFRQKGWRRWFLVGAALLGAFTIPASGSRTGVVLLVFEVGGMVILYLLMARHVSMTRRVTLVAAVVVVMVLMYVTVFASVERFWVVKRALSGLDFVSGEQTIDTDWRTRNWNWALQEVEKHPFIGMGLGTFVLYYDRHEVHSSYLSLWTEAGPLAMVAYIGLQVTLLVLATRALLQAWRWRLDTTIIAALLVVLLGQAVMSVTHTLTRSRNVAVAYWLVFLYSEYVMVQVRARVAQQQQLNAAHRDAVVHGRFARLGERKPRS